MRPMCDQDSFEIWGATSGEGSMILSVCSSSFIPSALRCRMGGGVGMGLVVMRSGGVESDGSSLYPAASALGLNTLMKMNEMLDSLRFSDGCITNKQPSFSLGSILGIKTWNKL